MSTSTPNGGSLKVALAVAAGAGGVVSLANPEAARVIITRVTLDITGAGPGSATADAGVAANGSTSADNLLDGVAIDAAALKDNITDKGTNGKTSRAWGASEYVTVTASALPTGLAGYLHIDYVRA
jgi:hypothetical protein